MTTLLDSSKPRSSPQGDKKKESESNQTNRLFKIKSKLLTHLRNGTLTDEVIDQLLVDTGLEGEELRSVREKLIGRREYLIKRFQIATEEKSSPKIETTEIYGKEPDRRSFTEILREVVEQPIPEIDKLHDVKEVICDSSHIEGQSLRITKNESGEIKINFKVRNIDAILMGVRFLSTSQNIYEEDIYLVLEFSNIKLRVSTVESFSFSKRSHIGKIEIIIAPEHLTGDSKEVSQKIKEQVSQIIQQNLEIKNPLEQPTQEQEAKYAENRYRWYFKIPETAELTEEQKKDIATMQRREVFPGYSTFVLPGRSEAIEKNSGSFVFYHTTYNIDHIINIIENGLLSTDERFSRGLDIHGMSSTADQDSGGSANIFLRAFVEKSFLSDWASSQSNFTIIINPRIANRTDWYKYKFDTYGSTRPTDFANRITDSTYFDKIFGVGVSSSNESMFRNGVHANEICGIGIGSNSFNIVNFLHLFNKNVNKVFEKTFIKHITTGTLEECINFMKSEGILYTNITQIIKRCYRLRLMKHYSDIGVTEINGIPVHEFFVVLNKNEDMVNVAKRNGSRSRSNI